MRKAISVGSTRCPWFSYLAFDIIGDLAFSPSFGMVNKGKDEAESRLVPGGPILYAPAVDVLNRRGEISSTLGFLPSLRPIARYLPDPFFTNGVAAVENLTGIAVAAVATRLDAVENGIVDDRNDILSRLLQAKVANGQPMGRAELTAEALAQTQSPIRRVLSSTGFSMANAALLAKLSPDSNAN